MKSMQLLIIIFLASSGMIMAGNGKPAMKISDHGCSQMQSISTIHINLPGSLADDNTSGSRTQERYYMRHRLHILKRPLFA